MTSRSLVVGVALAAAILGQLAAPALAGGATKTVEADVFIAASDAGKYELHIGDTAWPVTGPGAAWIPSNSPAKVQFWRVRDCHLLAAFTAKPGSINEIGVDPDTGHVTVRHPEIQDIPVEILTTQTRPRCSLPDTSIVAKAPGASDDWTSLAVGALMVGLSVTFFRRDRRLRRR